MTAEERLVLQDRDLWLSLAIPGNPARPEWIGGAPVSDAAHGASSAEMALASAVAAVPFDDVVTGTEGSDLLDGGRGNDRIFGLGGNDLLIGGNGADRLDGGAGDDTISYSRSSAAVTVSLNTGIGRGGDAEGDTLTGIESLGGSNFNDVLYGNAGANWLKGHDGDDFIGGLDGNDVLEGGKGADRLYGGAGFDLAYYGRSSASVTISLNSGTFRGGDAEGTRCLGSRPLRARASTTCSTAMRLQTG